MRLQLWFGSMMLAGATAIGLVGSGCTKTDHKDHKEAKGDQKKDDHSGWWCDMHGIPEHLCSLCLEEPKVKTMFKDKGDWCAEHERAKSQCFKCDPALYKKYEAMYIAKYGKAPEPPPQSEFDK